MRFVLDPVTAIAYLGTFGFMADVAGHIIGRVKTKREIARLSAKVDTSVGRADARGDLLLQAAGVSFAKDEAGAFVPVFGPPPGFASEKGAFAGGAVSPQEARAAREANADADAIASERIRLGMVAQLGEDAGALAFEFAQKNKPMFRRAVRAVSSGRLDAARNMLAPSVGRYEVKVAEGDAKATPSSSGAAWVAPY